jgi:YVTN family beta-propeller protein
MKDRSGCGSTRVVTVSMSWLIACLAAAAALVRADEASIRSTLPLELVADIPLGGHTTRLDYASIDPDRRLLFIAHLGDSEVIVFDLEHQRVVARIPNLSHVHGILAIPELGRVYASATGTNEVVAIDASSLKVTARIPAGVYPDGMAYAPDVHKLYVSDEHGAGDTVIDVRSNARIATIALGGDVGNTQYDPVSKHIFANVQTKRVLAEIDPQSDAVVARIELPGADGNHGLLIEPSSGSPSSPAKAMARCWCSISTARKLCHPSTLVRIPTCSHSTHRWGTCMWRAKPAWYRSCLRPQAT